MNHAFVKPAGYQLPIAVAAADGDGSVVAAIAGARADALPCQERLDVEGKTVGEVCSLLCKALRGTELEPEWLVAANTLDDPNEATSGARMDLVWPADSVWNRVAVSVDIGRSEGWIVHVDWITCTEIHDVVGRGYAVMPLLSARATSSSRRLATPITSCTSAIPSLKIRPTRKGCRFRRQMA